MVAFIVCMFDVIAKNKIILAVVILVVVVFAWYGFLREPQGPSTGLLTSETRSGGSAAEQEILRILLDMRSIRLDSALFENPAFASLRDFGREIVPEPVGRTNPFTPTDIVTERTSEDEAAETLFDQ